MPPVVPDLLTATAARQGERPALVMDDLVVTYAELEMASNRVARSLIRYGVRRGDRVALWIPKSMEAIVALWGVMKAGATYVPVDAAAPASRLAYVARQCDISALVTPAARAPELDAASGRADADARRLVHGFHGRRTTAGCTGDPVAGARKRE